MYLKCLEVTGFKSFPEKLELRFSPGVTAVIGPNGCGKSNLLDAVRWVLGEQSPRILRGSRMEELIFSGSAGRKAMNYAEVKLTLDEAENHLPVEYKEVIITRRLYRSGEGEYFLNNTPCRLKDIYELFWDTGIGRETYSLIGQGRIEQLINARPEDNRELLEEAAEVHKYKQRKKEALSRMEEVNRNLVRIEDLLGDLRERELSLKGEVSRAYRYKELLQAYRRAEKGLLSRQWWEKNLLLEGIRSSLDEAGAALEERKRQLDDLHLNMEQVRPKVDSKRKDMEAAERKLREEKDQNEKRMHRLLLLREQERSVNEKIAYKAQSHSEITERLSGLEDSIADQESQLKGIHKEQEHIAGSVSSLQEQLALLSRSELLQQLEELRHQAEQRKSCKAAAEQSLKDRRQRAEEVRSRRVELQEKLETARSDFSRTEGRRNTLSLQVGEKERERERLEEDLFSWRERLKDFQKEAKRENEDCHRRARELEQKKARLKSLKDSQEEMSDYSGGVKTIMQAAKEDNGLAGVHGPVAELIQVPQRFERAIDTALGSALQHIVTEDDGCARNAIGLLKEKKAGRATLLPLNLLRPILKTDLAPASRDGLLGRAHELVAIDPRFHKVVEYLLGNVLVAETLESAVELIRSTRSGWKIVTLDGEMISPGGAMSGGYHSRERTGILSRKRELKNLEAETGSLQVSLAAAEDSRKQLEEKIARLESFLKKKEEELVGLEKEAYSLERELERIDLEKKRAGDGIENLEREITHLQRHYNEIMENCAQLENELGVFEGEIKELQQEQQGLGEEIRDNEERYRQLEKELIEARVRFSSLQEKESSLQETYRRQLLEKDRLDSLKDESSREKERLKKELERIRAEKEELERQEEVGSGEIERLEERVKGLKNELEALEEEEQGVRWEIEKKKKQLERYRRRQQELDIEQVRAAEGEKYLRQQLGEKYGLQPGKELSKAFMASLEDEKTLEEEKGRCGRELSALGEVNVGVLQEHERIQQRISFLENQRCDLLEGEKGIREVVEELECHIKKRFLEALRAIENNFQDIFQQLFGGGQAFLKLTDPKDALESGVEIAAQPPGKQLKNISLLSGGEKALTAIALLFALLKYKPVPFCVLDEVDSSLDENNLARFILFLKRYTRHTQFILITHRKMTMEEADVLYGVTMEEQGVSNAVSLSLSRKVG